MKFSGSLSALLVVLPLLLQAAALPNGRRGGFGGFGGSEGSRFGNSNQNANKNNNNNHAVGAQNNNNGHAAGQNTATAASKATSSASSAQSTSVASSAQSTSAASSSQNNNNNLAATGGSNDANLQTSLTLDPSTIGPNLAQNGLNATGSEAGQAASLTSVDNFINFCSGKTITNGLQVKTGSCNPVPMGDIPANTLQPASKFISPTNGQNIGVNTSFTVQMGIQNLDTGFFVNPNTNYFGAPQQLVNGVIQGHSHFVIQPISSLTDTAVINPQTFSFFLGLNAAASNGVLSATVTNGLPEGTYRMASINTAANHQPALGPVAQHGSYDDMVYFTVGGSGDAGFGAAGTAATGSANAGNAAAGAANGNANNATTNAGAANTGAANSGAKNTGAANAGAKNTGAANSGAKNTGAANSGAKNTGAANNGAKNTGAANNGAKNTGAKNQGGSQQGKGRRSFNIARQD